MEAPELDDDGYPTADTFEAVEKWPFGKFQELMAYVKQAWHFADWGWKEEDDVSTYDGVNVRRYSISTGGWSGNESMIGSMRENYLFWSMCWMQSRRGGHYVFEVKLPAPGPR